MSEVKHRDPHEVEFQQAVEEVLHTLNPVFARDPDRYLPVMKRLVEPERMVMFRVPWVDDSGNVQVNRGFRVQFSSTLGPYKGGLRFHPTVNLSVIKFLGFEQCFKNALTMLPLGGGKGGSDFDPKGKSDLEIMRFCQSFMVELSRHIGASTDVPAGDIGVDGKVIGYLYGQYKRLRNEFTGVLTGKPFEFGGSNIRPEATGYGLVYFTRCILQERMQADIKDKRVAVSGAGNVAQFAVEKLLHLGAVPVTMSDSQGTLYEPEGISIEQLSQIMSLKAAHKRLSDLSPSPTGRYISGAKPWKVVDNVQIALPCATQNEVDASDAAALMSAGVAVLCEGANMPCDSQAIELLHEHHIEFGPAKACNAGGVAVSGLEMSQNSQRLQWSSVEVDTKLQAIMENIFHTCNDTATEYGTTLQAGANIASFLRLAKAMEAQGIV